MAKIGVQAMMLKDSFAEIGAFETLRKVSAIGYNAVEVSQIPMTAENVAELDRSRSRTWHGHRGPLGRHGNPQGQCPAIRCKDHFDKIVEDAKRLDAKLLRIGMLPFPAMKSIGAVVDFAKQANELRRAAAGTRASACTTTTTTSSSRSSTANTCWTSSPDNSPAMGMEIDVHWVQRGGLDPVRTLEQVRRPHGHGPPEGLPDRRDCPKPPSGCWKPATSRASWPEFKNVVQFAEVGEGNLDFPAIIPPPRPPAPSTCSWSRTNSTAAPSGTPCRRPTTTLWPWATPTSSDADLSRDLRDHCTNEHGAFST